MYDFPSGSHHNGSGIGCKTTYSNSTPTFKAPISTVANCFDISYAVPFKQNELACWGQGPNLQFSGAQLPDAAVALAPGPPPQDLIDASTAVRPNFVRCATRPAYAAVALGPGPPQDLS